MRNQFIQRGNEMPIAQAGSPSTYIDNAVPFEVPELTTSGHISLT